MAALCATLAVGCQRDIAEIDGAFYDGDRRLVHCGLDLDSDARISLASIDSGLDRARDRGEVVELYAHHPGVSVPASKIEYVLAGAAARGLAFVTYGDFARDLDASRGPTPRPAPAPGLALSFDDTFVGAWVGLLPLFAQYHARVTFFVSRYYALTDEARAGLHELAAAGHDVEAHSVRHFRAPDYVDDHGIDAYLHDELDPSIQVLRDDGFEVNAFAYPFGARTGELDRAIAKRVSVIRSVAFSFDGVESPCPH